MNPDKFAQAEGEQLGGNNPEFESVTTEKTDTDVVISRTDSHLPSASGDFNSAADTFQRPSRTTVSMIFDDAYDNNYTVGHPIFKDKDAEYGVAIPSNKVGDAGRLSWSQIDEMAKTDGLMHPIAHGYNSDSFSAISEDEIEDEIYQSAQQFLANGYHPRIHVYRGNNTGGDFGKAVTAEIYQFAFAADGNRFGQGQQDPFDLPRKNVDSSSNTISQAKTAIDNAINESNGIILYGHNIVDDVQSDMGSLETSTELIKEIIDYVRNQGATWTHPLDVIRRSFRPAVWGSADGARLRQTTNGPLRLYLNTQEKQIWSGTAESSGSKLFTFNDFGLNLNGGNLNLKGNNLYGDSSGGPITAKSSLSLPAQDLSSRTGERGEIAYNDGTTAAEGLYEWDNANSQWSGIGIASGNTI